MTRQAGLPHPVWGPKLLRAVRGSGMKTIESILPGKFFHEPETSREWFDLNIPWCPLFGELPLYGSTGPNDKIKNPTRELCWKIIRNARGLWKVEKELKFRLWDHPSWPPEADLRYPTKKPKTARIIFDCLGRTIEIDPLYLQLRDGKKDLFFNHQNQTLRGVFDEARDRVITIVRNRIDIAKVDKAVTDFQIMAIFAIRICWNVLRDLLVKQRAEDHPSIQKIKIAQFLDEYCFYASLNETIQELKPGTDWAKRRMKQYKEMAKTSVTRRGKN